MGWGSAYTKCPHCGFSAEIEVHTRSRDYFLCCSRCGYYEICKPIFDRQNKISPTNLKFKIRKDGEVIYRVRKGGGYGSLIIRSGKMTTCSHLTKLMNDKEIQKLVIRMRKQPVTEFCIVRWNESTKKTELVAGTPSENWQPPFPVPEELDENDEADFDKIV